jgi:hypothetical protein
VTETGDGKEFGDSLKETKDGSLEDGDHDAQCE